MQNILETAKCFVKKFLINLWRCIIDNNNFFDLIIVMNLINKWTSYSYEVGCDEVGRGCLCGPVVAAAVILPENFVQNLVNDSKKLTFKTRQYLDTYIKDNAIEFAIAEISAAHIDEINILNASIHAMHRALDQLKNRPEFILVDGNRFHPYHLVPHQCVIEGDAKFLSIACASILAKNYRDDLMVKLHDEHPEFGWKTNMGYATKQHREALIKFGPTPHHRRSFRLDYSMDITADVEEK